jgi:hypothetical protein
MLIIVMIMMEGVTEEKNGKFRSEQPLSGPRLEL